MTADEGDSRFRERPFQVFAFPGLHRYVTLELAAVIHLHACHGLHFLLMGLLGLGVANERFMIDGGFVDESQDDGLSRWNVDHGWAVFDRTHGDGHGGWLLRRLGRKDRVAGRQCRRLAESANPQQHYRDHQRHRADQAW